MLTLLWPSAAQRAFWQSAEAAAVYVPWDMLVLAFSLINNLRIGSVVLSSHLPTQDSDRSRGFLVVRFISTHFSYVYAAMSAAALLLAVTRRPFYEKHRLVIQGVRRCVHGVVAVAIGTQPRMLQAGALRHMTHAISSRETSTLKVLLLWNGTYLTLIHALICPLPFRWSLVAQLAQVAALCWRLHWHITLPLGAHVQAEAAPYCRTALRFIQAKVLAGRGQQATPPPVLTMCDLPFKADQHARFELFLMLLLALIAPLVPLAAVEYQTRAAFARNLRKQLGGQRQQPHGSGPSSRALAPQQPGSSSGLGQPTAAGRAASPLAELLLSGCWMIVLVEAAVVGAYFVAMTAG